MQNLLAFAKCVFAKCILQQHNNFNLVAALVSGTAIVTRPSQLQEDYALRPYTTRKTLALRNTSAGYYTSAGNTREIRCRMHVWRMCVYILQHTSRPGNKYLCFAVLKYLVWSYRKLSQSSCLTWCATTAGHVVLNLSALRLWHSSTVGTSEVKYLLQEYKEYNTYWSEPGFKPTTLRSWVSCPTINPLC